jgi:hypothetical protein
MTHFQFARRARGLGLALATTAVAALALSGPALADSPTGGSFVIGDQNVAVGAQVTFWGAQWWKDNPLSTASAPAAFKGYADNAPGTCGQTWTTRPGNSSDPPAGLSNTINVIVSSQIDKSGPVISDDVKQIVQVAVDPGYADNPGHPGTGTILGYVCGGPIITDPSGGGGPIIS